MKVAVPTNDGTTKSEHFGRSAAFLVFERSVEPQPPSDEAHIAATIVEYQLTNGKPGLTADLRQAQLLAMRGDIAKLLHRLNTLLFIVHGQTELVLLGPGNENKFRSFAVKVQQAAEEAAAVVQSLAKTLE